MILAAEDAASVAHRILWREGYVQRAHKVKFELNAEIPARNISGKSAGLALMLAYVRQVTAPTGSPAVAATGVVRDDGAVTAVEDLDEKLKQAAKLLSAGDLLFFPRANLKDVTGSRHKQLTEQGIRICPVGRSDEAIVAIGVELRLTHFEKNPYRGLRTYRYDNSPNFYGRTGESLSICELLRTKRAQGRSALLLVGASGTGKSSLLQAGVLPILTRNRAFAASEESPFWCVSLPGELLRAPNQAQLLERIFATLIGSTGVPFSYEELSESISAWGFVKAVRDAAGARHLIWIVDQLEQSFSASYDSAVRDLLFKVMRAASETGIDVLSTVRSDFYPIVQAFPDLLACFDASSRIDVVGLAPEHLDDVIVGPARSTQIGFEVNEKGVPLSAHIRAEASNDPDVLPLVSYLLETLYQWDIVDNRYTLLTWSSYHRLGGLRGVLSSRAELCLSEQPLSAQSSLPRLLRRLVKVGIRDRTISACTVPATSLQHDQPALALARAFSNPRYRLLTIGDGETYRLTHEALLRNWKRASDFIAHESQTLLARERIVAAMDRWEGAARPDDLLIPPGLPLSEAEGLCEALGEELDGQVTDYIHRSVDAETRRQATKELENVRRIEERAEYERQRLLAQRDAAIRMRKRTQIYAIALVFAACFSFGAWWVAVQREEGLARSREYILAQASQSDLRLASVAHDADDWRLALAYLARSLRANPRNRAAEELGWNLIVERSLIQAVLTHRASVNSAQYSPSGRLVVTASDDSTAQIWDSETWRPRFEPLRHPAPVYSAQFSPDGRFVLTATRNRDYIWDVETGARISDFTCERIERFRSEPSRFSRDSRWVLSTCGESLAWWNPASGNFSNPVVHTKRIKAAILSPTGGLIVTIEENSSSARVWDATTGIEQFTSRVHVGVIHSASFSPDGMSIVTASEDGSAVVWSATTGEQRFAPMKHEGTVNFAAFSPDGDLVVTASDDKTARVWNAKTGAPVSGDLRLDRPVRSAVFDSTSTRVVTASDSTSQLIWSRYGGRKGGATVLPAGAVSSVSFSTSGERILTVGRNGSVRVWDADSGLPLTSAIRQNAPFNTAAFSLNGRSVLTAAADGTARVWSTEELGPRSKAIPVEDAIELAAFSPDGSSVAISTRSSTQVWSAADAEPISDKLQSDCFPVELLYGREVPVLIEQCKDNTVLLWDLMSRKALAAPIAHDTWPQVIRINRQGDRLITVSGRRAQVTNVLTGQTISNFSVDGDAWNAALDGDGALALIETAGGVRLWDTLAGNRAGALCDTGQNMALGFGADGPRAVALSGQSISVWDPQSCRRIAISLPVGTVRSVTMSRDAKYFLSTSDDEDRSAVQIWETESALPRSNPIAKGLSGCLDSPIRQPSISLSMDSIRAFTGSAGSGGVMWDVPSGVALSGRLGATCFVASSVDGTQVLATDFSGAAAKILGFFVQDSPAPEWVSGFFEQVAMQRITEGTVVSLVAGDAPNFLRNAVKSEPDGLRRRYADYWLTTRNTEPFPATPR